MSEIITTCLLNFLNLANLVSARIALLKSEVDLSLMLFVVQKYIGFPKKMGCNILVSNCYIPIAYKLVRK